MSTKIKIEGLNNYVFNSLKVTEVIGGEMSTGILDISQDFDDINLDKKEINISLIFGEFEYNFEGFIEGVTNDSNNIILNIVFCKEEYYKTTKIRKYSGIMNMINSCSPLKVLNSPRVSSMNNSIDIYQNTMTDYFLITKFSKGIDNRIIPCHRFDGFFFTDLDKDHDKEVFLEVYDKTMTLEKVRIKDHDEKSTEHVFPVNGLVYTHYFNKSNISSEKYSEFNKINEDNKKYYTSLDSTIDLNFNDILDYRVGEILKAKSDKYSNTKYFITSNTMEFYPNNAKQFITLYGL